LAPQQQDETNRPACGSDDRTNERPVTGRYSNDDRTSEENPHRDAGSFDWPRREATAPRDTACSIRHSGILPVRVHGGTLAHATDLASVVILRLIMAVRPSSDRPVAAEVQELVAARIEA
jgi:hypothetical protein